MRGVIPMGQDAESEPLYSWEVIRLITPMNRATTE